MKLHLPPPTSSYPLVLTLHDPVPVPVDLDTWVRQLMQAGLSSGEELEWHRSTDSQTDTGWPLSVVTATVRRGGQVVGARLGAFYLFLELAAAAVVRCPDPAWLDAHRDELLRLLRAGRPSSAGDVVALCDLWA